MKNRKFSDYRSREPKLKAKPKILLSCEGETEKIYFNNFIKRNAPYILEFALGNETDPVNLVKNLEKSIHKKGLDVELGDRAICILDTDTTKKRDKILKEAKEIALGNNIKMMFFSPSFEIWFLLHLTFTSSYMTNRELLKRLKQYIPSYTKTSNIYDQLAAKMKVAIRNAKRLKKFQEENGKLLGSVEANPYTDIYKLVEYLIRECESI